MPNTPTENDRFWELENAHFEHQLEVRVFNVLGFPEFWTVSRAAQNGRTRFLGMIRDLTL